MSCTGPLARWCHRGSGLGIVIMPPEGSGALGTLRLQLDIPPEFVSHLLEHRATAICIDVIDGAIVVERGHAWSTLHAGGVVRIPQRTPYRVANVSDSWATVEASVAPAGRIATAIRRWCALADAGELDGRGLPLHARDRSVLRRADISTEPFVPQQESSR